MHRLESLRVRQSRQLEPLRQNQAEGVEVEGRSPQSVDGLRGHVCGDTLDSKCSAPRESQCAMASESVQTPNAPNAGVRRKVVPNSYIIAVAGNQPVQALRSLVPGITAGKQTFLGAVPKGDKCVSFLEIKSPPSFASTPAMLKNDPRVLWVAPNYVYEGAIRDCEGCLDGDTTDPLLADQIHHKVTGAIEAWKIEEGNPEVVIAVTDDGFDLEHEDLHANIWTNPKEIPDNGIDEDGNGYTDDVHGWDMNANDNNVRPDSEYDSHGTHVSGIVAATKDNGVGGCGTAPGVRLLPIKWTGENDWSSAVIARSFIYAANNGARIVTTSYNADGWPGDQVIEEALKYMDEKGILYFNSAGNNAEEDSARTKLETAVLVASTEADGKIDDKKSGFSNFGRGVDISAPGGGEVGILSTMPGNKYERMSGTSMASPNAAGAAGLIWSHHPEWTREQVWAQLAGTATNIDAMNPEYVGKLGHGRVNPLAALTQNIAAPRLDARVDGGELIVRLRSVFDLKSANTAEAWRIERKDTGEVVTNGAPAVVKIATNELRFALKDLAKGDYRLVASAAVLRDPFAQALDGNGDGTAGDDFVFDFAIA